jgi:hypothetical protein
LLPSVQIPCFAYITHPNSSNVIRVNKEFVA